MVLNSSASFVVSSILALLTFSGMQMLKLTLASSQMMTILGGFLGSVFFVFLLTAVGNLEVTIFGKGFQTKLIEAGFCLFMAVFASAAIHRVSATTCIIFSMGMIYTMSKISHEVYSSPVAPLMDKHHQKKKK